jgi:hypothetical protein
MVSMAASTVPSMPAIDISQLATLDERTGAGPDDPSESSRRSRSSRGSAGSRAAPAASEAFAPPTTAAGTPAHLLSQAFKPPPEAGEMEDEELAVERSTRAIRIANQFRNAQAPEPAASPPAEAARSLRVSRSSLRTPSSPPDPSPRSSRSSRSSLRPESPTAEPARPGIRSSLLVLALVAAVAIAIFATVALRH